METKKNAALRLLITILIMYAVTLLLLLIFAAMIYKMDISTQITEIGIIAIYVLSGFLGGFLMGKQMKSRKFLWGILVGLSYFCILLAVSLGINGGTIEDTVRLLITFVLCTASSMIGGMVS